MFYNANKNTVSYENFRYIGVNKPEEKHNKTRQNNECLLCRIIKNNSSILLNANLYLYNV